MTARRGSFFFSSSSTSPNVFLDGHDPDPSLVNAQNAPQMNYVPGCAVVYRNVLSEQLEKLLIKEISGRMKRRRYERGHWDAVITGYKEIELADISFPLQSHDNNAAMRDDEVEAIPIVFEEIRQHLAERHLLPDHSSSNDNRTKNDIAWLPCHAIDLKKSGELKAHVDSVRFSGDLVAGISLKSPSIMRLKIPPKDEQQAATEAATATATATTDDEGKNGNSKNRKDDDDGFIDLYLPPRSLYALTGVARYCYSHELLPDGSIFVDPTTADEMVVEKGHRISIIFRDAKKEQD